MSRPWQHPDSRIYWFRKRVPHDLRNLVGTGEVRFTLGTRDPKEAKRLYVIRLAEVEERWANLRAGQRPLSSDDVAQHASAIGEHLRRQIEADPYQQLKWDIEIGANLWSAHKGELYMDITQPLPVAEQKRFDQRSICYWLVDQYLGGKSLTPRPEDREKLARAVTLEVQRVVQSNEAYLRGKQEVHVGGFALQKLRAPAGPLAFEAIIQDWVTEKNLNAKTQYTWRRVMNELSAFVGHDDARRVGPDDLVRWKGDLLAKGRAAKTIRDSKLARSERFFSRR
jgi:hypothetical protein